MTDHLLKRSARGLRTANRTALALSDFTEVATQRLARGALLAAFEEPDEGLVEAFKRIITFCTPNDNGAHHAIGLLHEHLLREHVSPEDRSE